MLSSKFLVVSFLYLFYATGVVVAVPRGGDQFCESVRTVTIVQTVTNNQPPPSSSLPNNANPPPSVATQNPGTVNLGNGGGNNKNGKTNPNSPKNKNGNSKNGSTKTSSTSPAATPSATPPGKTNVVNSDNNNSGNDNSNGDNNPNGNNSDSGNSGDNNSNGDPASSLTLDPSVIQNISGRGSGAGQSDSIVSPNNFINYCVGKTLSNGQQVKTGSCNPTPMGDLPSVDNMPSAKFQTPKNFDTIPPNTAFTISLKINNIATGTFVNAANAYFAAPQQLVGGIIKGHSHITVQQMQSLDSTQPLDPKVFAFFKGVNDPGTNGVLSVNVASGLPAGVYRISSVNAAANHQEAMGPVAQRGSFNDAIYITVADGGQNANDVSSSSVLPVDSTSSTVLPTSVSSDVPSSSVSSPAVSPSSGGDKNGGKDSNDPSSDSLPVPTSSSPDVSPTAPPPVPTGTNGGNGDGKNSGGKNDNVEPSDSPVPSTTDGGSGGKEDDPTSTPLPTPTPGNDNPATTDPTVPPSATPPDSTPKGDNGSRDNNGQDYKRMQRRSRLA